MTDFQPTHIIETIDGRIPVCASDDRDGPLYTEGEWRSFTVADWEVTGGRVTFQGEAGPGSPAFGARLAPCKPEPGRDR